MGTVKLSADGDDAGAIKLPAKLDTAAAGHLHSALAERMGQDISLLATEVEYVGGRCLDVLLAAKASCLSKGKSMTVISPSGAMVHDLVILGSSPETLSTGDAP